ncbi:peptidase family m1 domain-containing protein [Phthorimaea operculella]|nr:peptidase family m1 domain-containing protein [Phthorimaea operculella]
MFNKFLWFFLTLNCLSSKRALTQAFGRLSPKDPSSYSRPDQAVIKHVDLKLYVDFARKTLKGSASLIILALQEIKEVILDVSSLSIKAVEFGKGILLKYRIDKKIPDIGSRMTIQLNQAQAPKTNFTIKIHYTTSPKASALQWLEPSQTSGKKYPFMYSQCAPIHARSILPCQDTPSVKFTYTAEVSTQKPFKILMGALVKTRDDNKTVYVQPEPITNIWAEEKEIKQAAEEFKHIESYISSAEKFCGDYTWHYLDLLLLPPSFPYDGMENPCLTFVSSALVAGDRSLAPMIIHEVVHSWFGNLVTPKNFEHYWLKEGFTVFIQRKVQSAIASGDESHPSQLEIDFRSLIGLSELKDGIEKMGENNPLTKLVVNLTNLHPDEAISVVPNEKGYIFLRYLEDLIGIEVFDLFIKSFVSHFAGKSLDTDDFKAYMYEFFSKDPAPIILAQIDWDKWFYGTGMPPVIPQYDRWKMEQVDSLLYMISETPASMRHPDHVAGFSGEQFIQLLQGLLHMPPLPIDELEAIGKVYGVADSKNSEYRYRWFRLCCKSKHIARFPEMLEFVNSVGRLKYVRDLYSDMYEWKEVRHMVITNFLANEHHMMHVTATNVRNVLHLEHLQPEKNKIHPGRVNVLGTTQRGHGHVSGPNFVE